MSSGGTGLGSTCRSAAGGNAARISTCLSQPLAAKSNPHSIRSLIGRCVDRIQQFLFLSVDRYGIGKALVGRQLIGSRLLFEEAAVGLLERQLCPRPLVMHPCPVSHLSPSPQGSKGKQDCEADKDRLGEAGGEEGCQHPIILPIQAFPYRLQHRSNPVWMARAAVAPMPAARASLMGAELPSSL
jgi:hypothetical protein